MIDRQVERSNDTEQWNPDAPVPAARPLSDFTIERVGDDLVIFDGETMQYHTVNAVATSIWRACDGIATAEAIAASTGLPVEVVETTIAELGEASLIQSPANTWSVAMNRRRAAKVIAAGAVGAVGIPVVLSVTAPSHQAAATTCHSIDGNACNNSPTGCNALCGGAGNVVSCLFSGGSTSCCCV